MIRAIVLSLLVGLLAMPLQAGMPDPQADRKAYVEEITSMFPGVAVGDYANGIYAIDAAAREQWQSIEEFPPYEIDMDEGKDEWEKSFANGKTYQSCFTQKLSDGIRQAYPQWDDSRKRVVSLELALNECRTANGEKPLKWKKGKLVSLSAYVSYQSRGQKINVSIPNDDALKAYADGKKFYYTKRGQLNMSCADCHIYNAGNYVRADHLSAGLGHPSHFPVYRSKWQGMGSLHRRFGGCNKNIRAKPFKAQGPEYSNLEYFLTYMSNGLEFNGPGARK